MGFNEIEISRQFDDIEPGTNILFQQPDRMTLLKYEAAEVGIVNPQVHRINRHSYIDTTLGSRLQQDAVRLDNKEISLGVTPASLRPEAIFRADILGTHRLDFITAPGLSHCLVDSPISDLYLDLAVRYPDGSLTMNPLESISTSLGDIKDRLCAVVPEHYFEENIVPFLEDSPTNLCVPSWDTPGVSDSIWKRLFNRSDASDRRKNINYKETLEWLREEIHDAKNGDFLYIGSNASAYMMGVSSDGKEKPYMQGTYLTSSRPLLFFTGSYLHFTSASDVERTDRYHQDASHLGGKPFVYGAIGRQQNCYHTAFDGRPEIITTNVACAREHFAGTQFSEFISTFDQYAAGPTPKELIEIVSRNGSFYY